MLPQSFPFQLIEVPSSPKDDMKVRLSIGNALQRGVIEVSPILTLEMLAQASILSLQGAGSAGREIKRGFVAGFEAVRFADELAHQPLRAGDLLRIKTRKLADFGRLLKIEGEIERDDRVVVRAELMLGFEG